MNKEQVITVKYTRLENGTIAPFVKPVTVAIAIDGLSRIIQHSNDYAVRHNGALIVALTVTDYSLIASFDSGASRRIDSVEKFTEFLHELTVTKLLQSPDSGLMAMYPISLEMWL